MPYAIQSADGRLTDCRKTPVRIRIRRTQCPSERSSPRPHLSSLILLVGWLVGSFHTVESKRNEIVFISTYLLATPLPESEPANTVVRKNHRILISVHRSRRTDQRKGRWVTGMSLPNDRHGERAGSIDRPTVSHQLLRFGPTIVSPHLLSLSVFQFP